MKKIFIICISILMLYGGSYTSIHQRVVPKGLLNEINNSEILEKGGYGNAIKFSLSDNAKKMKDGKWCGNSFYHRYKIFVPSNKYCSSTIGVAIHPNSVVYVLMHFIPQDKAFQIAEIDWTKNKFLYEATPEDFAKFFHSDLSFVAVITNIRTMYISTWKKNFSSGWLYLQFVGASDIEEISQFKTTSYNIRLSFAYEELTEDKVKEFIKNTIWNKQNGDPIDGFKEIKEKVLYCSEYGKIEPIYGIQNEEDVQNSMIPSSQSSSNQSFSSQSSSSTSMSQSSRDNKKQNGNESEKSDSSNQSSSKCKEGEIKDGASCVIPGETEKKSHNKQNDNNNENAAMPPETNPSNTSMSQSSRDNKKQNGNKNEKSDSSNQSSSKCKEGEIKDGASCVIPGETEKKSRDKQNNNDNNKSKLIKEIINKKLKIKAYWVFYGKDESKEPLKWLLVAGDKIAKLNSKISWIELNNSMFEKQLNEQNLTIMLKLKESSKDKGK